MNTYRSTKDIAALVRETLKKELPAWKFSVRVQNYSCGSSITLSLMSGPEQVVEARYQHVHSFPRAGAQPEEYQFKIPYTEQQPFPGYAQLNHYQLEADNQGERELRLSNGEYLTPLGWSVMKKANEILSAEHWDKSDAQTDYFCCNFYRHLEVGQWNKDYQVKP